MIKEVFKKFLGVHSPSEEMKKQDKEIIEFYKLVLEKYYQIFEVIEKEKE